MSARKSLFISHASSDKIFAVDLCRRLEACGLSCWIAPRDIRAGHDYGEEIEFGIQSSSVFLLLLSEKSNLSHPVRNEIERAFTHQKLIVPLRIQEVMPHERIRFYLGGAQWVDAYNSPISDRVEYLAAVVQAASKGDKAPLPDPPRRTLAARAERVLERALRHKTMASLGAVALLTTIGISGILLQISTRTTIDAASGEIQTAAVQVQRSSTGLEVSASNLERAGRAIQESMANVKQESSEDPRKELANLGIQWSTERFLEAVRIGDLRTIRLFLAGGMSPGTLHDGCSIVWRGVSDGMQQARQQFELFVANGLDVNKRGVLKFCSNFYGSGGKIIKGNDTLMDIAIIHRNGEVVDALLATGAYVASAHLAMLRETSLLRRTQVAEAFIRKYEPIFRENLSRLSAHPRLSREEKLTRRGLSVDSIGLAAALEFGDMEAIPIFRALGVMPDHDMIFRSLTAIRSDNVAFTESLRTVRAMGFDVNRPSRTLSHQNEPPFDLLTIAIRWRDDAATRILLAQGARVTQAAIDALDNPYRTEFGPRPDSQFPIRWRPELMRELRR